MIPTRTLKFWGFKEHPFADNILRDDLLKLFVNRGSELSSVEDALGHSRVVGVYGTLGVGKSSFLQKLKNRLKADGHPVAYVHLTADSEETLYRELLAELLVLLDSTVVKLKITSKINVKREAQRLYACISESRGANFGGKLLGILGGEFKENKTTELTVHDEASARNVIRLIFNGLIAPLVVIFDDFEKLKYQSNGKTRDYFPILSRFIATLEEHFNHKEVSFVLSMDNQVEVHQQKHRKNGGEFAFALNSLCGLSNLSITHLHAFIRVRLKGYRWKGTVSSFMTEEAFLALALASSNHPRRAVRILAEALKVVADNKKKTKRQLDLNSMRIGSMNAGCPLDEKDWITLKYISKHGESSANDNGLRLALGYKKPNRTDGYASSVNRRLISVAEKLQLEFEEVPTGQTRKHVLCFPRLPKGW